MSNDSESATSADVLSRAQGCLLGQFAGEMLGMPVETLNAEDIRQLYPDGLIHISDGETALLPLGIHHSEPALAQLTDDGEMAIMLARALVDRGEFDAVAVRDAYVRWWNSPAFGFGRTVQSALERGHLDPNSQTNGALMRISPLGILGANFDAAHVADWARQDSRITHSSTICQDSSAVFTISIARAIRTGCNGADLHSWTVGWSEDFGIDEGVIEAVRRAADTEPPYITDAVMKASNTPAHLWVVTALHNAFWQLLHSDDLRSGVIDTVMQGGDTDTTAAICGALFGAVQGRDAIPAQWSNAVLHCRPHAGRPHVFKPRHEMFWPTDTLEIAERLLKA